MENQNESDRLGNLNEISKYIDVILEVYKPADPNNATHYFSTDEIFTSIKELNPGAQIQVEEIFTAMENNGFMFHPRAGSSGISFKWLLALKY